MKRKNLKCKIWLLAVLFLFTALTVAEGEWVTCNETFGAGCPLGGCKDPNGTDPCVLESCDNDQGGHFDQECLEDFPI